MLIASPRHSAADLRHWATLERGDALLAKSTRLAEKERRAAKTIAAFAGSRRCYLGVSWGKDSVVVAGIAARAGVRVPFVWVRVEPMANPDCVLVRDAFLRAHNVDYHEILVQCERGPDGQYPETGRLKEGFVAAAERFGDAYISGVRGDESGSRKRRMAMHGTDTLRTCAPIGWWSGDDVFAYLYAHGLPVHPAYACTMGGALDRKRLRVATIGGSRGTGHGRAEWETRYYRETLRLVRG